ncbi:hypothetical protein DITRI_Ditri14bG0057300 [Diplodiscus trichospermus]
MKAAELIFVPSPGASYLFSTIEFANRLIHQDDRILITILSMKWLSSNSSDGYTKSLAASQPDRIQIINLPQVDPPSLDFSNEKSSEFEKTDPEHLIPGFANPVPSCVLPTFVFDKHGCYTAFVKFAERFKDAKGIMINTFAELKPYPLDSLSNGQNPPLYPVGPVIHLNALPYPELDLSQRDKVMRWLDDQP